MSPKQTNDFLEQIAAAYPNFEVTPQRVQMWGRQMKSIEYDLAVKRLDGYSAWNKFPPTVADIASSGEMKQRERKFNDETRSPAESWGNGKKKDWMPFFSVMKEEYDLWLESERLRVMEEMQGKLRGVG